MDYQYVVLSAHLPGQPPVVLGVLLLDAEANQLHLRFRADIGSITAVEADVVGGLPDMLEGLAHDLGANGLLAYLEDVASNAIRVGERRMISEGDPLAALSRAYADSLIESGAGSL